MKISSSLIKKSFIWLLLPVLVFMSLFLLFPAFNIIDDGASLLVSQHLKTEVSWQNWRQLLVEEDTGRFRPIYHLSFFLIYMLMGLQPFGYWLLQTLILASTLIGLAIFLHKVTKQYWISALAPLSLLFFTPLTENFFRLGTAEPKQFLVFTWLLVITASAKNAGWNGVKILSWLVLFTIALLTKETSLLFIGMIGFTAIWNLAIERKQDWSTWLISLASGGLILLFFLALPEAGSYSGGFQLNFGDMWNRLLLARLDYAAVLFPVSIAGVSLVFRFCYELSFKRKIIWRTYFWPLLLLCQLLLVLGIGILPWTFQLPRYYYPVYLIGLLLVVVEVTSLKQFLQKHQLKIQLWQASIVVPLLYLLQLVVFQSATSFGFTPNALLEYLASYTVVIFGFLLVASSTFLRIALTAVFKPSKEVFPLKEYFTAAWFGIMILVTAIVSLSFWQSQWPRNFYLLNFLILGYLVSEVSHWKKIKLETWFDRVSIGPILSFGLAALLITLSINQRFLGGKGLNLEPIFGNSFKSLQTAFDTHQVSYALIKDLITDTPVDAQIFVSGDNYEVIFEIGLYASNLKQRQVTIYTSNQDLVTDLGQDYPYLRYLPDPIAGFINANQPKQLLLRQENWKVLSNQQPADETQAQLEPHRNQAWENYSVAEKKPFASLGSIPSGANWVVITD